MTPIAPAPIEEIETSTPIAAPVTTVSTACRAGGSASAFCVRAIKRPRKRMLAAVATSANPSTNEISAEVACVRGPSAFRTSSVAALAGTLPPASRPTMRQLTAPLCPWTAVPTALVTPA